MKATKTKSDRLKEQIIRITRELLVALKEDIETGIQDGLYDKTHNRWRLKRIAKAEQAIDAFEAFVPSLYIYVEGGNIQGITAEASVGVSVFYMANYRSGTTAEQAEFVESFGTQEEWDKMIAARTSIRELKSVY